ncbi:hypothetical protein ONZ51_g5965 [Trametes cubensis]|uniref:Major facilitator superfamily (MFS) profile domain-containing protein n=1 Tax=Trametes cubensis TaxID=1111947 RepID=A0AAD7XD50_9APHY|nr:hypothetical protein ONZ51_g5965 [Trametes cubensis]
MFVIANLIGYLAAPSQLYTLFFNFMLGKLYINSLLTSLNSHEYVRGDASLVTNTLPMSTFRAEHGHAGLPQVSDVTASTIAVDSEKEVRIDMPGETTGSSLAMRTAYKQIASAAAAGTPWKHMRQDPRRIRSDRCFGVGSMISLIFLVDESAVANVTDTRTDRLPADPEHDTFGTSAGSGSSSATTSLSQDLLGLGKPAATARLTHRQSCAMATRSTQPAGSNRGVAFWMVFASNLLVDMLSALDLTAISTALPTIVDHLHGTDFIWAGSAYTIASTAILPLIGNLVSAFGRKPSLVAFILTFALGSAISGAAQNMNMLIAGRTVQGLGGGGCIAITEIIYADLVPLPERGKFQGITASVWAFACAVGPPIGGALADSGAWRWLFFLNLPLCGLAVILTTIFLRVHTPRASFTEKITQMDWTGISVMIGSTISILLAITWGGLQFPWASGHVLAPLIIGAIGILTFFVLEMLWLKGPTVPRFFFTSRTTLSGYLGTFFHGIVSLAAVYYLPVYFQATKGASAVGSGVDLFPLCLTIPAFAIATGLSVQIIDRYRPQNYIGWAFIIVGFGVLGILDENSSRAAYIGSQVPLGVGLGIIWISTQFPILAPLPYSNSAHALAFFTFMRCFAQSWGIVVGGTILQNELLKNLPDAFRAQFPGGVQIAYAVIPAISSLPATLKDEVRAVFARATRLIWQVMIGVSGAGLLSVFLMREEKLRQDMDEQWGLREDGLGPASLQSQNELEWKVADAADVELAQVPPAERK